MQPVIRWCLAALAAATASLSARAQCAAIPGTGCPGQSPALCRTRPQIGTTFTWLAAPCLTSVPPLMIFGTVLTPTIPIPPPIVCGTAACDLGCQPLFVAQTGTMSIPIPNLRVLVGATVCIQSSCIDPRTQCLTLSQATSVTVL